MVTLLQAEGNAIDRVDRSIRGLELGLQALYIQECLLHLSSAFEVATEKTYVPIDNDGHVQ